MLQKSADQRQCRSKVDAGCGQGDEEALVGVADQGRGKQDVAHTGVFAILAPTQVAFQLLRRDFDEPGVAVEVGDDVAPQLGVDLVLVQAFVEVVELDRISSSDSSQ